MKWESLGQCVEYVRGVIQHPVALPVVVSCRYCPLLVERRLDTYQCRLTDEWVISPSADVGAKCPIVFDKE